MECSDKEKSQSDKSNETLTQNDIIEPKNTKSHGKLNRHNGRKLISQHFSHFLKTDTSETCAFISKTNDCNIKFSLTAK